MFGWICMISGLQRSCCSLQSESLIFTVPISLQGAPLMAQNKCWVFLFFSVFFFFSWCGHYVFWAAQCLSGRSFMNSVTEKEAVTEKFCGFSSPFIQPVLNYGLSAQQGKVKFAECQHKQLCLAGWSSKQPYGRIWVKFQTLHII